MKTEIDIFVINNIRREREKRGISQRGLSEVLGRALGFVGQVESPHCDAKYSVYQIYLIAQHFSEQQECKPSDFFPPIDISDK